MTKVEEGKGEVESSQEIHSRAVHTDEQGTEGIQPGKGTLNTEAFFVDKRVEQAFTTALRRFLVAGIKGDVGDEVMIEAKFAERLGVERTICVQERLAKGGVPVG